MRLMSLLLLLVQGVAGAAQVEKVERPKTEHGFVTVHLPAQFDPEQSYSVLYWFHGTGGRPNPGIGLGHERLVTVGMSYLKRDQVPPENYGGAHWEECLALRAELEARGLKLERNLVAGMSKGGWMSFYIAAKPREQLHAAGIFAAGKDPNLGAVPSLEGRGLSVLVGTGETDPNFPQAQLAVRSLREAGAQVFYEEWLGEGHTYHRDGRVRNWLDVETRRDDPERLVAFCDAEVGAEMAAIMAIGPGKDRYVALRKLAGDPRLRAASESWRERVRVAGKELSEDEGVRDWLAELAELRGLVGREATFFARRDFDVSKLGKLVEAYDRMLADSRHPDLAARAAYARRRAAKMLAIYTEQMKAREDPEYRALMDEYGKLQARYAEAKGKPGDEVMGKLKEVGARLGELRHQASMGAFRKVERGGGLMAGEPEAVGEAIEAGANLQGPAAFGGIGF